MKKIIVFVIMFLLVLCSCNDNDVDVSNLNEELLTPKVYELKSVGFVGNVFKTYLATAPNSDTISYNVPTKEEFKNGEYTNGVYKLTKNSNTYSVGNDYLQISDKREDGFFEYRINDNKVSIKYKYYDYSYDYSETYDDDKIVINFNWEYISENPLENDSKEYEIRVYDEYFEVICDYYHQAETIKKEVYYSDGTFKNFETERNHVRYLAYKYSVLGLKETYVDNGLRLKDESGNLFLNYALDEDDEVIYSTFIYEDIEFLMFKKVLFNGDIYNIKDVLVSYSPMILDENSTKGLNYKPISDSEEYEFYSLGTSKGEVIIVSSKVNGKDVTMVAEGFDLYGRYISNFDSLDRNVEIYLPDTIKKIGRYGFANCDKLTKIVIPNSCDEIGKAAFYGCILLEEVTLPSSLKYLENYTFSKCSNLTYLYIPENLEMIGSYVFEECTSLKELNFGGSMDRWNELTKYTKDTLYNNTCIEKVICIDGVIEIEKQ